MTIDINTVWSRLKEHAGEEFYTISKKPFTYLIEGDIFQPSRAKYQANKSDFAKALELVPFPGPGIINDIVRCPAYVYGTLHDSRIRRSDW